MDAKTTDAEAPGRRAWGSLRRMGASLQVRVSEATDAILTGALGWISCNPMPSMKRTAKKRP